MFFNVSRIAAIAIIAGSLAGCVSQEKYDAVHTALEGSASLRAKTIEACVGTPGRWSKKSIEAAALVLDVSESKAPRLACQRAVNAVASGRMTYADMVKLQKGDITAKVVKILQGR